MHRWAGPISEAANLFYNDIVTLALNRGLRCDGAISLPFLAVLSSCKRLPRWRRRRRCVLDISALVQRPHAATALIADIHGGLRENGLVERTDYVLETRFAAGHYDRFADLARELSQAGVNILLANTIVAVRAAQHVVPPVPVVMLYVSDPVGTGLVASLSRPGGLTTGMAT